VTKLAGKVAVVTGSGWGFGPGISLALARDGADVVLVDLSLSMTEAVANTITALGRRALPVACDLAQVPQIEHMMAKAVAELGAIDILVNNGQRWSSDDEPAPPLASLEDISGEWWDHTFEIGVKAAFLCSRAVFPHMKGRGGKIINVASDAGIRGTAKRAHYAASSEAIRALTKCTAFDWGRHGINANVISPSVQSDPSDPPVSTEGVGGRRVITGRVTQDDAGALAVFLAGEGTDYVTGQTFVLGGRVVI
jgi:NAD(P)-dependent dehydrogenase (short-subunit alcohol dehydrogenase family)